MTFRDDWIYATATGTATATPQLYVYLSGAGTAYLDDIKLVAGSVPEVGPNLLPNGGFETGIAPWLTSGNHAASTTSPTLARSGGASLKIVATSGGGGTANSVYQANIAGLTNGQTYTVSYWYVPAPGATLTVRLSGSQLVSSAADSGSLYQRLEAGTAGLGDYRAWFCLRAVNSPRQLFEVLSQFWENHFVTQFSKSRDYLLTRGYDNTRAGIIATDWEFRHHHRLPRFDELLLLPKRNNVMSAK